MGKTKSKISSTSGSKKEKKDIIERRQVLQTPGFTNECHDICYPIIHGDLGIMGIIYSFLNKWKDPQKGRNYFKYNKSIGIQINKLAASVSGLANLGVPKVFPCPKILMLCTQKF